VNREIQPPTRPHHDAAEANPFGVVGTTLHRRIRGGHILDQRQRVAARSAQSGGDPRCSRKNQGLPQRPGPRVGAHHDLKETETVATLNPGDRRRHDERGEGKLGAFRRQRPHPQGVAIERRGDGALVGVDDQDGSPVRVKQESVHELLDQRKLVLAQVPGESVADRDQILLAAGLGGQSLEL